MILNMVPPKAGVTAAYGYGYTYGEDKFGLAAPERRNRRRAK